MAWLPEASVERELGNAELVRAGGKDWQAALTLSVYAEPVGLSKRGQKIWTFFDQLQHARQ